MQGRDFYLRVPRQLFCGRTRLFSSNIGLKPDACRAPSCTEGDQLGMATLAYALGLLNRLDSDSRRGARPRVPSCYDVTALVRLLRTLSCSPLSNAYIRPPVHPSASHPFSALSST